MTCFIEAVSFFKHSEEVTQAVRPSMRADLLATSQEVVELSILGDQTARSSIPDLTSPDIASDGRLIMSCCLHGFPLSGSRQEILKCFIGSRHTGS